MAHPGTLPVPNKDAIKKVIQVGLAIDGNIADFTEFDRKNYFYPDIPKGYQLSQYKFPIVSGGIVNGVAITRVHLEEDTAKSSHVSSGQGGDKGGVTLIDYNRAGVPLMELVTEPVIHTREEASAFARELQRILRYVGASEANMEMGQMRIEVNISVSKDPNKFGTKVEVKNINSFAAVEGAIDYEIARHIEVYENGGTIVQETRGWDEVKLETISQRKKENAHDYRYFPDPDLPKLYLKEVFDIQKMKTEIPELPKEFREKLKKADLPADKIDLIVDSHIEVRSWFNSLIKDKDSKFINLATNYFFVDFLGLLGGAEFTKEVSEKGISEMNKYFPNVLSFTELINMYISNQLSSRGVKDLLWEIRGNDYIDVKQLAEEKDLIQKNDPELLKKIVAEVLAESPTQIADYKSGKEAMFMYFVGQCMKKSKGSGNPGLFQELLKSALA